MEATITADENTVCEKMKATFSCRHSLVNDEKKAAHVFSVFPWFGKGSSFV